MYITLDGFTGSNQLCNCKMCDPYRQRLPVYYNYMISKINKLIPDELISYICSFIDHSDVKNKFLNIDRFIPSDHYEREREYNEEMEEYYRDYDEDDYHCND